MKHMKAEHPQILFSHMTLFENTIPASDREEIMLCGHLGQHVQNKMVQVVDIYFGKTNRNQATELRRVCGPHNPRGSLPKFQNVLDA